jgi:DNA-binding IclR family transcriptional regulator
MRQGKPNESARMAKLERVALVSQSERRQIKIAVGKSMPMYGYASGLMGVSMQGE